MKKTTSKKLELKKQVIARIDPGSLKLVAGGLMVVARISGCCEATCDCGSTGCG